jgi:transcriptional regulator with XRE-family HTH domain
MAADVTPLRKVQPRAAAPEPRLIPEPLWREVLGSRLRELRHERRERLTETAARAGISPQYLSEVERGRKEPSSEMIAALAGAFGLSLVDLTTLVTEDLRRQASLSRADLRLRQAAPSRVNSRASGPVALLAMAA